MSGRQNILDKMKEAGFYATGDQAMAILKRVERLEAQGYTFEGADASVTLMILHADKGYCPPFQVPDYSAQVFDSDVDSLSRVMAKKDEDCEDDCDGKDCCGPTSRATIKVRTVADVEVSSCYLSLVGDIRSVVLTIIDFLLFHTHAYDDEDGSDRDRLEMSDGNGPVDALAKALKRALIPTHPVLERVDS